MTNVNESTSTTSIGVQVGHPHAWVISPNKHNPFSCRFVREILSFTSGGTFSSHVTLNQMVLLGDTLFLPPESTTQQIGKILCSLHSNRKS